MYYIDDITINQGDFKRYSDNFFANDRPDFIAKSLVDFLIANNLKLSVAESCTGGFLSQRITSVSGCSSAYFGGVCSYSNEVKSAVLGVSQATLAEFGAVSAQTAEQMSQGALRLFQSDVALSTTGIAGPMSDNTSKPVGLVYIGVSLSKKASDILKLTQNTFTFKLNLNSDNKNAREHIRFLTASIALDFQTLLKP